MNQKLRLSVCIAIMMLLCIPGVYSKAQGLAVIDDRVEANEKKDRKVKTLKAVLDELEANYDVSIAYKSELVENQNVGKNMDFSGSLEKDLDRKSTRLNSSH